MPNFISDTSVTMAWRFHDEETPGTRDLFTQIAQFIALLQTLAIMIDIGVAMETLSSVAALGREHGLSAYDGAFLGLAMRQGLPLATQDARLRAAAHVGVPLL